MVLAELVTKTVREGRKLHAFRPQTGVMEMVVINDRGWGVGTAATACSNFAVNVVSTRGVQRDSLRERNHCGRRDWARVFPDADIKCTDYVCEWRH